MSYNANMNESQKDYTGQKDVFQKTYILEYLKNTFV